MPQLDPFARQLVDMIRELPDEAILDLVRNHLEAVGDDPQEIKTATTRSRTTRKKRRRGRGGAQGDRAALLDRVEGFVRDSNGVGLGDVAEGLGEPKSRIQSALRDLKKAGRVAAAGDRRFTRYAADAKTARAASKRERNRK